MVSASDYRVRYVNHEAAAKEKDEGDKAEEPMKTGFRLWSSGPNFDTDLPQDVTGVVGHTAYLTCRVFDRTNSTVSIDKINLQIYWLWLYFSARIIYPI